MEVFDCISYTKEVSDALSKGLPVVAIETAGTFEAFEYPLNEEVGNKIMNCIRDNGAVPAYIAIIKGQIKVGLNEEDVEYISNPPSRLMKSSRRDIPMLIATKKDALTSVASTMMIADLVGIKVVTGGGIGGVHRGASETFDISADLEEFTKSEVVVVSSGAKSILDLNLTMEYLETHSVSMGGYRTNELPAYMAVHSGIKLDFRFDSPAEVASCFKVKRELKMPGSLLVCNPVEEKYAVDSDSMNAAILKAVKSASDNQIKGKVITKYIMDIVRSEMGEDSTETSIQMNLGNARLAAQIASEI